MAEAELKAKLKMDGTHFERGMRKATEVGRQFVGTFAGLFAGGAIISGLKGMLVEMDRIGKLSTIFNTTAESIQRIKLAADLGGVSIEQMAKAMSNLRIYAGNVAATGKSMEELSVSTTAVERGFGMLGLNAADLQSMEIDEMLITLVKAMKNMGNETLASAAVLSIFGSRGKEMLPLLKEIGNNMDALETQDLIPTRVIRQAEAFNDALTKMAHIVQVDVANFFNLVVAVSKFAGEMIKTLSIFARAVPKFFTGGGLQFLEQAQMESRKRFESIKADVQDFFSGAGLGPVSERTRKEDLAFDEKRKSDREEARKKLQEANDKRRADEQAEIEKAAREANQKLAELAGRLNESIADARKSSAERREDFARQDKEEREMRNLEKRRLKALEKDPQKADEINKRFDKILAKMEKQLETDRRSRLFQTDLEREQDLIQKSREQYQKAYDDVQKKLNEKAMKKGVDTIELDPKSAAVKLLQSIDKNIKDSVLG